VIYDVEALRRYFYEIDIHVLTIPAVGNRVKTAREVFK